MILFPAIDLKDGACVRLVRGDLEQATIYNEDAAAQARAFREIGFAWLHVVDLDGAVAGGSRNGDAVDAILWAVGEDMKVQLGGGIRDRDCIESWLEKGVERVILGTAALRDPDLVRQLLADAVRVVPAQAATLLLFGTGGRDLIFSASRRLEAGIIDGLRSQNVRRQFRLAMKPGRANVSLPEHLEIIDAICARDSQRAETAMREHMASVIVALRELEALRQQEAQ